jgi:hypothetical protein
MHTWKLYDDTKRGSFRFAKRCAQRNAQPLEPPLSFAGANAAIKEIFNHVTTDTIYAQL